MFWLLFCLSFIFLWCLSLYRKRYRNVIKHINKFPGPKPWPLVGNIFQLGFKPHDYFRSLMRWMLEFDFRNFCAWAGPLPYVIVLDTENIEQVLSGTIPTYKYDPYNLMYPWLGNGLLTSNSKTWAKRRKMITPSFHFRILKDFLDIINDTTERFVILLEKYAAQGVPFDFQSLVALSTVDVICETAMGTCVNSINGKETSLVKAIETICNVISERVFSIFKRSDFFFRLSPLYWQQRNALRILRSELVKIIEERRKIVASQTYNVNYNEAEGDTDDNIRRPKKAFLDNLLTAQVDDKPLSFEEIFEEVSTFMFEGHDTTASAIAFSVYCLSRHPKVQESAYQEQQAIYGAARQRHPTYQELQDMKYLELFVKETLRLFPSVPYIFRNLQQNTTMGDKFIPKDTTLVLPILGFGHNPRNFEQPYEFKPERFESDKRLNANPFEYVPFSAGPRNCIGQKFAMLELKVTLSKILRNFHVLPPVDGLNSGIREAFDPYGKPQPHQLILNLPLTLKSANGVHIRLKKRD